MGRAALDEDAIRLIEEHNPEIEFDWTQILRGGTETIAEPPPAPPSSGRQQTRRQRPSRGRPEDPPREQPSTSEAGRGASSQRLNAEPETPPVQDNRPAEAAELEPLSLTATLDEYDATLAGGDPLPAGGVDDFERPEPQMSAAGARLGAEGLLRLRARHAEVLARISERIADPARQEELKAQAERLNPDTWVTDQEVTDGLEQYEAVFDSLRAVVGRKRTRRRRRRGGERPAAGSAGGATQKGGDDGDEH